MALHIQGLVSAIIPVYNGETFLAEALASVAAQSLTELEIIVVDDGSTDRTRDMAQAFGDPRLRYFRQANAGASVARNHGVEVCRGEMLAFLDADDLWTPDKLRLQMASLERGDGDMIFGNVEEFASPAVTLPGASAVTLPGASAVTLPGASAVTLLMRRTAFERVGRFNADLRIGEFIDWYARAIDIGMKPAMLPQVLTRRRLHAHNQGRHNRSRMVEYARVMKLVLDRRRKTH